MREHNLTVKPNTRLIAKRISERPKPRPVRPMEWWGIDMTKVMTESGWKPLRKDLTESSPEE